MRRVLKGAVPLLAAAALGLAHPTTAPCSSPPPTASLTVVAAEPEDDAQDLPRVVAPHRLVLEPLKAPSSGANPPTAVVPADAATPADVDLLAPPTLPPAWSKGAGPVCKVPVVPSGLPAAPQGVAAAAPRNPKVAAVHAVAATQPAPAIASRPEARTWPAAFVTAPAVAPVDAASAPIRQVVHLEPLADAGPPPSEAAAPISLNRLKQRVAVACGGAAANVGVEAKQSGSIFVKVRLRDAAANQAAAEKIMQIPEMTAPNVHLLMEVGR